MRQLSNFKNLEKSRTSTFFVGMDSQDVSPPQVARDGKVRKMNDSPAEASIPSAHKKFPKACM